MKLTSFLFIFMFSLTGCIVHETDFDYVIYNNYKNPIEVKIFFQNYDDSLSIRKVKIEPFNSIKLGMTLVKEIAPALKPENFNELFYFISIKCPIDSLKASTEIIKELNKINNWTYKQLENERYYYHHQYLIKLNEENLGFN